jgi:hypothetical protein
MISYADVTATLALAIGAFGAITGLRVLKWQKLRDVERNSSRVTLTAWPQAPGHYEISVHVVNRGERAEYVERVCVETLDGSGRDVSELFGLEVMATASRRLEPLAPMRGRIPLEPEELQRSKVRVVAYLTSGSVSEDVERDDGLLAGLDPAPGPSPRE